MTEDLLVEFRDWVVCGHANGSTCIGLPDPRAHYSAEMESWDGSPHDASIRLKSTYVYEKIYIPIPVAVNQTPLVLGGKSEKKEQMAISITPQEFVRPMIPWWLEPNSQDIIIPTLWAIHLRHKSNAVVQHVAALVLRVRQQEQDNRASRGAGIQIVRR